MEASLSKTRKTSKDQKRTLSSDLPNECSEKIEKAQVKLACRSPASVTLTCEYIRARISH